MKKKTKKAPSGKMSDDELRELIKGSQAPVDSKEKMETNLYPKKGETLEIVFMDDSPFVLQTHSTVRVTKSGIKFFPKETCQKIQGSTCLWCDAVKGGNASVKEASKTVFYPVFSLSGGRDKDKNLTGEPKLMFIQPNSHVVDRILKLKEEEEGTLEDLVCIYDKTGEYPSLEAKTVRAGKGKKENVYYEGDYPEPLDFEEIWKPCTDEQIAKNLEYLH